MKSDLGGRPISLSIGTDGEDLEDVVAGTEVPVELRARAGPILLMVALAAVVVRRDPTVPLEVDQHAPASVGAAAALASDAEVGDLGIRPLSEVDRLAVIRLTSASLGDPGVELARTRAIPDAPPVAAPVVRVRPGPGHRLVSPRVLALPLLLEQLDRAIVRALARI